MQVSEVLLRRTIGRKRGYLDLHSVVDGFRAVSLISLVSDPSILNSFVGISIPPLQEQRRIISRYLALVERRKYKFIRGYSSLYFIATSERAPKVHQFLNEYGLPLNDEEGLRVLGNILGFSQCCIDACVDGRSYRSFAGKRVIPFVPCSRKCGERWLREYEELARQYDIGLSTRFLK